MNQPNQPTKPVKAPPPSDNEIKAAIKERERIVKSQQIVKK